MALAVEPEPNLQDRLARYPRMRFMGSKHRLAPRLAEVFDALPPGRALDAFSGSGVVAYTLKVTGREVLANDHLAFAAAMTQALVANDDVLLTPEDVELLCSPNRDGRDFIERTFDGLYFPAADHAFLDAAWSHLDDMDRTRRAMAISALCLAAARKQPRGVFTITTPRYDDGRRQMRMSLRELFREAVADVNAAVFAGAGGVSSCAEVFDLDPAGIAVAYLDPPYAPPRDDTCYIKRYHFLEGLATYWRGQEIMWGTRSRKLVKRHTPFAYKRTVRDALDRTFAHFTDAALVVSYGSNAALGVEELEAILRRHTPRVERIEIPHTYAFGTHGQAQRRVATEYVLVGHRSPPEGFAVKVRHSAEGHWLDQAAPLMTAPLAPLSGEVTADVAIVGGGYTGMWCAWHLLQQAPDARIVLLESDRCGHGPSGRNGGFCHGNWLPLAAIAERLGPEAALSLALATQEAAEDIGRWCEEQGVDAWYRRGGELRVSTAEAHDDVGLASVRAAQALGVGDRLVDLTPAQVRDHCDSPVFRRGVFAPDGATVHPGRLALGLRSRLLERGVALHEYSHVRQVTGAAGGVTLETASARVRARHAVLASGGALARTGPMRGRVLVGSSHLIVTEPVPDVIEQLGWGDEAISDARSFLHYTRTTQDGRIAFGWAGGRPAFGGRVHGRVEIDPRIVSALHAHLLRWFPMLEGRAIDHAWGGPIDITPSRLPAIVSLPGGPVHAAAGFTGNGVGPSHLVGRILASLALDRRDAATSLPIVEPPSAWIPPEPLRWAGAHAVRAALLRTEDAEEAGERVPALARAVATAPARLGITLGR